MNAPFAEIPGWYGKLSCMGDFAHRRLPPQWIRTCDEWLSRELRAAEQALGVQWLRVYLTAPVLRFAWAPDVIDDRWWFGVLMPSCDNVGRYYPLLVAQQRPGPPDDGAAWDHLERWYEHVAAAALRTLEDADGTLEALESSLARAPSWPRCEPGSPVRFTRDAAGDHLQSPQRLALSRWVQMLALHELPARWRGCTIWWRSSALDDGQSVDVSAGLPRDMARLLAPAEAPP